MSLPLTINTIPAEHGAVEHQLVDAVGWIHARIYNRSDANAAAVKTVLEGRPTPVPVFDLPAMLDPPSPDLVGDEYAEGYVAAWNACVQRMAASPAPLDAVERFNKAFHRASGTHTERMRAALAAAGLGHVTWTAEDACEAFIAAEIDAAPEALRRLGEWLNQRMDEDDAKTASRMVLGAMMETSGAIRSASSGAARSAAAEVIALADERTAGYAAREHGGVLNGRVADKLVELAARLRSGQPQPEQANPREQAVDHVRCILLSIASCSRDDAAVVDAKRALDILDGKSAAPATADADVLKIASKVGVFYHDGKVSLGAPLYAFTPAEIIAFARSLVGGAGNG